MKKTKLWITPGLFLLATLACGIFTIGGSSVRGSGNVIEESRPVSGVNAVDLATVGRLVITPGENESLRIEAEDNLLEYIESEVRGGRLTINIRSNAGIRNTRPINYYLTVTDLESITVSSAGDVEVADMQVDRMDIRVSSSGNIRLSDLDVDTLTVNISSSGNVDINQLIADSLEVEISSSGNAEIAAGQVNSQFITINSSGNYAARELISGEADVRLNSSGSATIRVQDRLTANLSSSGDLRYLGSPVVDANATSSGQIVRIGD